MEKSDEERNIDSVMAEAGLVRESINCFPRRWRARCLRGRKMKVILFVCLFVLEGGVALFVY